MIKELVLGLIASIVMIVILGGCAGSTCPEPVPTITLVFCDSVPPDDWPFEIDEVIMSCTLWIDFSDSTLWQKNKNP